MVKVQRSSSNSGNWCCLQLHTGGPTAKSWELAGLQSLEQISQGQILNGFSSFKQRLQKELQHAAKSVLHK